MRPRPTRPTGQSDMFRGRLDQIINLDHELPRLARLIDWGFIEGRCGEAYSDIVGQSPLPTRLMTGSTAERRRMSRLMAGVMRRLWPAV